MATKVKSGFSCTNISYEGNYPARVSKLAGRDFSILTIKHTPYFERWIFPKVFNQFIFTPFDKKTITIGRLFRKCDSNEKFDELRGEMDKETLTTLEGKTSELDGDYFYLVKRVFEEQSFFEALRANRVVSTKIEYNYAKENYYIELTAAEGKMILEAERIQNGSNLSTLLSEKKK